MFIERDGFAWWIFVLRGAFACVGSRDTFASNSSRSLSSLYAIIFGELFDSSLIKMIRTKIKIRNPKNNYKSY